VTQLVEDITIKITLNHDKTDSEIYSGKVNLWGELEKIWSIVPAAIQFRDGHVEVRGGALKIEWRSTGLEEQPEETGGDN
jgi:hypothetical protein